MNNLIKIGFILIVIANVSFSEEINKGIFNTKLPRIELELNTGLFWLVQCKGIININDYIYGKFRLSGSFLASECGFTAGYQYLYNNKNRTQIGLGYSNGKIEPWGNLGGPSEDYTTEYWKGLMIEGDFMHYFKGEQMGFNIGFNFIIASGGRSLPSVNLGFILCLL